MTDPFRSPLEQLQERIRRAEERAEALEEEKQALAARLRSGSKWRAWVGAIVVSSATAAALGYAGAALDAAQTLSRERAERAHEALRSLELERARTAECLAGKEAAETALLRCERPATRGSLADCRCDPNDPLCSCLPSPHPPFSRILATSALTGVEHELAACLTPARALAVHARVTFQPTGDVSSAEVDEATSLAPAESRCMVQALGRIRVPRFSSSPTTVRKTYAF